MSQLLLNPVFSSLANDKCSMEIWMKPAASHLPRKSFKERQQVVILKKRLGGAVCCPSDKY